MKYKKVEWGEGESILHHFDDDTVCIIGRKVVDGKEDDDYVFMIKRSSTKSWQQYQDPSTFGYMQGLCYTFTISYIRRGIIREPRVYYAP